LGIWVNLLAMTFSQTGSSFPAAKRFSGDHKLNSWAITLRWWLKSIWPPEKCFFIFEKGQGLCASEKKFSGTKKYVFSFWVVCAWKALVWARYPYWRDRKRTNRSDTNRSEPQSGSLAFIGLCHCTNLNGPKASCTLKPEMPKNSIRRGCNVWLNSMYKSKLSTKGFQPLKTPTFSNH